MLVAIVAAIGLALSVLIIMPGQAAHAASRVDVSQAPSADGPTTVTLSGSGFQYQPNAPGGVYIFFGAVNDPSTNAWAPSQGGKSGQTFAYANTSGAMLLAAFQGGSSASVADGVIMPDGTFTATMTIPGARFAGAFGNPHDGGAQTTSEIDCLRVQCGVITIGAHGMVSAKNESFTPVNFVTSAGTVAESHPAAGFDPAAKQTVGQDDAVKVGAPATDTAAAAAPTTETAAGATASAAASSTAAPPAARDEAKPAQSSTSSVVWIVLGLAALALLGAVVYALTRRRAAGAASTAVSSANPTTENHPDTPKESEL